MAGTFLSIFVALLIGLSFGPLLGRVATQWFAGRGLSNVLIEMRGTFLPFLIAPAIAETTGLPGWLVIGLVVGCFQAIAVGRWIARRTGEWSPELLGGIALGRSRAALISARATARGAVVSTLSTTAIQVVLLEALLTALAFPSIDPSDSVGGRLARGGASSIPLLLLFSGLAIFATEAATSWILQRRVRARST